MRFFRHLSINDDIVQPGKGFESHGHQNMEIISYVISGTLEHKDSAGNEHTISAGEVQRMSAGSGIMHCEYNPSNTEAVNFLQIWITPSIKGTKPSYQQKKIEQASILTPLVTPNGQDDSLTINQDASLYRLKLNPNETFELKAINRTGYLHVVRGSLTTNLEEENNFFNKGDAFAVKAGQQQIIAKTAIEALWFNLPIT